MERHEVVFSYMLDLIPSWAVRPAQILLVNPRFS